MDQLFCWFDAVAAVTKLCTLYYNVWRRCRGYRDGAGNTVEENSDILSLIRMQGMQALKLCSNKILQFLSRVLAKKVVLYNGSNMIMFILH